MLSDGSRELGGVTTQIQLLHLYWSHRVIGNDLRGIARENLLRKSLDQMLEGRILRVPFSSIQGAEAEDLYKLNSNGVLAPVKGVEDRVRRVAFAHHVLFDYGIARLVLEGGEAPDFSDRLTHSDERALFIAPGATMALQMLWQGDTGQRDQFWKQSLTIAAAEGSGAFCRMLPARVAASLTNAIEEWNPIFQSLQGSDCTERKAAIFLVRHCTGALSAGIPPTQLRVSPLGPWPQIARRLSEIAVGDVGWMLKPLISEWVEKPTPLDDREREDICAAARLILRHGSGERYEIGMVIIGIQAIARTLKVAPEASIQSLYQLLVPEHVRAYGHKELFWLAQELKYLLPLSSLTGKLIGDIYRAGYCTPLPSSEEVTSIFDSRIVGMTSNKRQDFESARYLLQQFFPRFLESDPVIATEAFVDAAKCTMEEAERDIGDVIPMMVGDVLTGYQPDNSYISYSQRDAYSLFGAFESGLRSLADGGRAHALTDVVATVVARNHLACVWTALLRMGSFKPETLGRLLVPLSCAAPILEGLDTRKPAGDLIKALHPLLESSERVVIERAILNTNERTKAILLGCLDERNIELPEALHERESLAQSGGLPENRAPFVVSGFAQGADDWWLQEKGVDLTADANFALNQAIKSVQRIKAEKGSAEQNDTIANKWGEVQALRKLLQANETAPEALRMSAWDAIAEAAETAALSCKEAQDLEAFSEINEMIFAAAASGHWPVKDENNQEAEEAFARGPSWGSPAPRIAAAGAAMALLWAQKAPDEQMAELVLAAARDFSPAVRHQILCRTNMLFASDKPLMMDLCNIGLQQEENAGVLGFFLAAIQPILQERPVWFAEHLVTLDDRFPSTNDKKEGRDELTGQIVQLMLRLWVVFDQERAGRRVEEWAENPVLYSRKINSALFGLRSALVQGDPDKQDVIQERIRARAIWIYERVAAKVAPQFLNLIMRTDLSQSEQADIETTLRILDQIASQIYFGSGAFEEQKQAEEEPNPAVTNQNVRSRFLRELTPTLEVLSGVPYPSIKHYLLQTLEFLIAEDPPLVFRIMTDALVHGGRNGQYQFESLGVEIFVRMVRRYLADFRGALTQSEDLRQRLMQTLDIFVEAGWPAARRLVYDLPEMLR